MYKKGANKIRDRTKKWITKVIYFDEEGVEIDKKEISGYIKTSKFKYSYEYGSFNFTEWWVKCERTKQTRLL